MNYLIVPISKFRRYVFNTADAERASMFASYYQSEVKQVKQHEVPSVGWTVYMGANNQNITV